MLNVVGVLNVVVLGLTIVDDPSHNKLPVVELKLEPFKLKVFDDDNEVNIYYNFVIGFLKIYSKNIVKTNVNVTYSKIKSTKGLNTTEYDTMANMIHTNINALNKCQASVNHTSIVDE